MSVKIFILCAFFGAAFARDTDRGRIVNLVKAFDEDIKFVDGQTFQVTQKYRNVNQILEKKIGKITRLEPLLLSSLNQIEKFIKANRMEKRGLSNGSDNTKKISKSVAKCIQSLLENLSSNHERITRYLSKSVDNLQLFKLGVKNQHPQGSIHDYLNLADVKRQSIMKDLKTFVNLDSDAIKSMTLNFDHTPVYAKCLADNSSLRRIKSLDALRSDVKSIFDDKIAGGSDDKMKSAMEKLFHEFNDNVGDLEHEIKTWE